MKRSAVFINAIVDVVSNYSEKNFLDIVYVVGLM